MVENMSKYNELMTDMFESIYGLDLDRNGGNMTICKSAPLMELPKSPMSLIELKIFDVYLARIHPQNPDVTRITFEKRELEELFKIERITNNDLKKALTNLTSKSVTIFDGEKWLSLALLSTAELTYVDRDHTRLRALTLECSENARKYIYNLGAIRYFKMNLARMVSFDSRHGYALYQYLIANSYRTEWDVNLYELKEYLGVAGKYKAYTDFDRRVLKVAFEEISANTEMQFTYKPVVKYNKTQKVHFKIKKGDTEIENKVDEELKQQEQEQEQVKPNNNVEHDTTWLDGKITIGLYDEDQSDEQLGF